MFGGARAGSLEVLLVETASSEKIKKERAELEDGRQQVQKQKPDVCVLSWVTHGLRRRDVISRRIKLPPADVMCVVCVVCDEERDDKVVQCRSAR